MSSFLIGSPEIKMARLIELYIYYLILYSIIINFRFWTMRINVLYLQLCDFFLALTFGRVKMRNF